MLVAARVSRKNLDRHVTAVASVSLIGSARRRMKNTLFVFTQNASQLGKREITMPLLRVDAYKGRSKEQVKELLDAIHCAVLSAFGVPLRDRYQVYQEHSEEDFIVEDTGLGIERTKNAVFIAITSRPRTEEQKIALYAKLVGELKRVGIEQNDIVVSIVTNSDADWSFGNGRAQFLTGELT